MWCIKTIVSIFLFSPLFAHAQSETFVEQYHVVGRNRSYMPISIAHFQNKKKWYAEDRYNYEDVRNFSLYMGKTFSEENFFSYSVTPLIGGAVGSFNGVSTGINVDMDFRKFFLSSQTQYSISTDHRTNNFFYNWSELAYQPLKWFYGGVSVQHTRLYQSENSFEPGVLLGLSFRNLNVPFYTFGPLKKDRYFMIGLTVECDHD